MTRASKPVRGGGVRRDEFIETHPAYGMISASRVQSSPGEHLFGSDFRHSGYVVISFGPADVRRDLSNDWYHRQKVTHEVALSEAQWATFVSTMNVGDGVPCTIRFEAGEGDVDRILPIVDRRAQLSTEVTNRLDRALKEIDEVLAAPGLRKADQMRLRVARQEIDANLGFVAEQFDRSAEKTIEKAKIEIAAYLTQAVQRAGLAALAPGETILELEAGEPDRG